MNRLQTDGEQQLKGTAATWPRWWRWTVIGASVLVLCSCRGLPSKRTSPGGDATLVSASQLQRPAKTLASNGADALLRSQPVPSPDIASIQHRQASYQPTVRGQSPHATTLVSNSLPPGAFTGEHLPDCPRVLLDHELPMHGGAQWAPPGIARPWPPAEYIYDGGDRGKPAYAGKDWEVRGLDPEDTIAHYDTLDGRIIVEPSNRVCIYAPRFRVVRRVDGLQQYTADLAANIGDASVGPAIQDLDLNPGAAVQLAGPLDERGVRDPNIEQLDLPGVSVSTDLHLREAINDDLPFENLSIIRKGIAEQAERPLLAIHVDAAIEWTHEDGVSIILDGQKAHAETGDIRAQATFTVDNPNRPCLRIVKLASCKVARPGDFIDFVLRFDNTGSETIGNVTIMDNLTTRLEYVPKSQSSSLPGDFVTVANEVGSLKLRWEIKDPLPAGHGGTIRFRCRVR
ncbi:MAG: DUF11 domain-containing protein [Planctomycetota bacterium]|nr:MAG: DUF11 domain-containing protein [Planctomycetota bacterium]REK40671.1 MAG: DUF11 domain-containing protein [Planctomycetota bacterium]